MHGVGEEGEAAEQDGRRRAVRLVRREHKVDHVARGPHPSLPNRRSLAQSAHHPGEGMNSMEHSHCARVRDSDLYLDMAGGNSPHSGFDWNGGMGPREMIM
jgi:hypothetical protein